MARAKRVLLVANPVARGVSRSALNVITKALSSDFKLEVYQTDRRGHALEVAKEAVSGKTEVVVVFSGDGTVNEVVNGIAGTDVALGVIPGGATNVLARNLGIPTDPLEATLFVIDRVLANRARRMSVGTANGRYFAINCGVGVDAELMRRVEERSPRSRVSMERAALGGAVRVAFAYVGRSPDLLVRVDEGPAEPAVSVLIARTSPYAYFKTLELKIHPSGTPLDGGLDVLSVRRLGRTASPRIVWEVLFGGRLPGRPGMDYAHDADRVEIASEGAFPVQLDGEYVGEHDALDVRLARGALWIVA